MTVEKLSRIFQIAAESLYITDDSNVAVFPGASGLFSTFDLTTRGHYEVHGEEIMSSPVTASAGQRFAFTRTPPSSSVSSTVNRAVSAAPRPSTARTFQRSVYLAEVIGGRLHPSRKVVVRFLECGRRRVSRKDDDTVGISEVAERIEELVLVSQSLPAVTIAIRELTNLTATQRVFLAAGELQIIKEGFSCVICKDFTVEPMFSLCCKSIIGCKTCIEAWQQTSQHCAGCRDNSSNALSVTSLTDTLSVLKLLYTEE